MKKYPVHRLPQSLPWVEDWTAAHCLTDFTLPWEPTVPPGTEFRALWDEQSLHFRFDCVDHDLVLGKGVSLKERVLGADRVEIFFTPELSLDPYYAFEMSPQAEALVYAARSYRQYDWDWQCPELEIKASIQATGYQVQGRLPLAVLRELGVLKAGSNQFYAGVYRAEFSHKPDGSIHSGWMPWVNPQTERPDFHTAASFGVLELL